MTSTRKCRKLEQNTSIARSVQRRNQQTASSKPEATGKTAARNCATDETMASSHFPDEGHSLSPHIVARKTLLPLVVKNGITGKGSATAWAS